MFDVNAHIHTPYSFSAFSSIAEALDKAVTEGVKVVGINDFYSTDGYVRFDDNYFDMEKGTKILKIVETEADLKTLRVRSVYDIR